MKNEIYLRFGIFEFDDITPNQITDIVGIKPFIVQVKGQKKNPKNLTSSAEWKSNSWIIDSMLEKFASFEEHMNAMLDIIEPKMELLMPLCEKYYCEFSCALYVRYDNGESIPSVHLGSRYNRLLKNLKIEFDFDIYCIPDK